MRNQKWIRGNPSGLTLKGNPSGVYKVVISICLFG